MKPVFDAFSITKSGDKSFWTKIGAAWKNRDGSLNVVLHCLPIDGKLQLREPSATPEATETSET